MSKLGRSATEAFIQGLMSVRKTETWMDAELGCEGMDPNLFFPSWAEHGAEEARRMTKIALSACERCPVTLECLDFRIRTKTNYGIFGGVTETDWRKNRATYQSGYPHSGGVP